MNPRSEARGPATGAADHRDSLRLPGSHGLMRAANASSIAPAHRARPLAAMYAGAYRPVSRRGCAAASQD